MADASIQWPSSTWTVALLMGCHHRFWLSTSYLPVGRLHPKLSQGEPATSRHSTKCWGSHYFLVTNNRYVIKTVYSLPELINTLISKPPELLFIGSGSLQLITPKPSKSVHLPQFPWLPSYAFSNPNGTLHGNTGTSYHSIFSSMTSPAVWHYSAIFCSSTFKNSFLQEKFYFSLTN